MDQETEKVLEKIRASEDYFEKAKFLLYLKREKQVPLVEISKYLGLKSSYLSHILRLNKIPELIKDGYYSKLISISHLFILSRLSNHKQMITLYEQILAQDLTTQQTDSVVRELLYEIKDSGRYLSPEERENFTKKFSRSDIEIKLIQSRLRGKLIVTIKGNLERTSEQLRKIMRGLEVVQKK